MVITGGMPAVMVIAEMKGGMIGIEETTGEMIEEGDPIQGIDQGETRVTRIHEEEGQAQGTIEDHLMIDAEEMIEMVEGHQTTRETVTRGRFDRPTAARYRKTLRYNTIFSDCLSVYGANAISVQV
jgi:hypothetical protein